MKERSDLIIGCDWGTTIFRIRIIEINSLKVLAEFDIPEGIGKVNSAFLNSGEKEDRFTFFSKVIARHLKEIALHVDFEITGIPIVASGMASSTIGMKELSYGGLPFSLNFSSLQSETFEANDVLPHPLILVSGLRDVHDVMRGEEVQLLGLSIVLNEAFEEDSVVILPGTHSKHCFVEKGELFGFQTFMTGELYQLLAEHSILHNSVYTTSFMEWSKESSEAFFNGVVQSGNNNMLANLFKVRTNILLDNMDKKSNAMFLSGLLIGEELRSLTVKSDERPIFICGGKSLNVFYLKAIEALNLVHRCRELPDDILTLSTIAGQVEVSKIQKLVL